MLRNDYRRALIMLRSLRQGLSGYVRLERRTLMGTMQFTVNGATAGEALYALLLYRLNGLWYAVKLDALGPERYGQIGMVYKFDPRNIAGQTLEQYALVAVASVADGVCNLVLAGNLNGSVDADWPQVRQAVCQAFRATQTSDEPLEVETTPEGTNCDVTPIPKIAVQEESATGADEAEADDTPDDAEDNAGAEESETFALLTPDEAQSASLAVSATPPEESVPVNETITLKQDRIIVKVPTPQPITMLSEAEEAALEELTQAPREAPAPETVVPTPAQDTVEAPTAEVVTPVPTPEVCEIPTPDVAAPVPTQDDFDTPAAEAPVPEADAFDTPATETPAPESAVSDATTDETPAPDAFDTPAELPGPPAADEMELDISEKWPECIESLRGLYRTRPSCRPFDAEGFTLIRAPIASQTGIGHCVTGISCADRKPHRVLYGIPARYTPEPPPGLEGYVWRGDLQSGYWIIIRPVC